ncbi:large conductance mechanosensitive channel protein MscL [Phytoactinopolyspora alkaliphila]|uniref:Large-conductance mechanosensitive channel n=1 Tax=Phytoactinopolyspora alkaliphila TaxID=1783498 RepID=A0A6N9YHW9_9ACTN|nr:large conductance mechanosensitive channel protein MscL [Phytoactinopolyspora alkaliphila]NED94651.1 large conductance mechanosensitive channel protein MscL [Phytoactinopolyspora alkaliphila]
MLKGFRDFISRGNVIDLAVAVVIGAAFSTVIAAVVEGLISPLVAAIFGEPNLTAVGVFEINDAVFSLGLILDAAFKFLIVAAAIYFVIIVPFNKLRSLRAKEAAAAEEVIAEEVVLLREIRDELRARQDGGRTLS